jgi:hypothetical protein
LRIGVSKKWRLTGAPWRIAAVFAVCRSAFASPPYVAIVEIGAQSDAVASLFDQNLSASAKEGGAAAVATERIIAARRGTGKFAVMSRSALSGGRSTGLLIPVET